MRLTDVFLGLGEANFAQLLRGISIGKLKTFQMYERVKLRFHMNKLNSETLRSAAPRLWQRIASGDDEFATDMAQTVLVSHLDMIIAVLDFLKLPHENGFFAKDIDAASILTEGWQQRAYEHFHGKYPEAILVFYLNHLAFELLKPEAVFLPAPAAAAQ